jgi:hypothetical protein
MLNLRVRIFAILIAAVLGSLGLNGQVKPPDKPPEVPLNQREINTALMESTFRIEGQSGQGKTIGTVFIMGRPMSEPGKLRYVLITAAHVLEEMQGNIATLYLRRKTTETDWVLAPQSLPIREKGSQLWVRHPNADVAVMYIAIPDGVSIPLISTDLLISDKELSDFEIHAGDTLNVLGYPLGMSSNDAGFPILRSGRIASYPLLPTDKTKTFLLDFVVFKGNSGSPVYLVDSTRVYHGATHLGMINFIAGLVTQEISITENLVGLFSETRQQLPLGLAVVVHASLIKQAINMLPSPDAPLK